MSIQANLNVVRSSIGQAAQRSGRDATQIELLGVTKSATERQLRELVDAGLQSFGENRIQQAVRRLELLPQIDWHFIGNLQTNKVRFCRGFSLIHSLDRWRLARALNQQAEQWGTMQNVLIQVNVSGEASKSGVEPSETGSFVKRVLKECPNLNVRGLMMMAPYIEAEKTRPFFRTANELFVLMQKELGLNWDTLSMGMTNDYEVAIEEGATLVRVGSALFSEED